MLQQQMQQIPGVITHLNEISKRHESIKKIEYFDTINDVDVYKHTTTTVEFKKEGPLSPEDDNEVDLLRKELEILKNLLGKTEEEKRHAEELLAQTADTVARLSSAIEELTERKKPQSQIRKEIESFVVFQRKLNNEEFSEFSSCLRANPWLGTRKSGLTPSEHIRKFCSKWFDMGLTQADIRSVLPNLASAYATEINRYPERRINELSIPKKELKDPDKPRPPSRMPIAALSAEEKIKRRIAANERKRRFRAAKGTGIHTSHPCPST